MTRKDVFHMYTFYFEVVEMVTRGTKIAWFLFRVYTLVAVFHLSAFRKASYMILFFSGATLMASSSP